MNDESDLDQAKPEPADPTSRRTALPWQMPKSDREDKEASARIARIMQHPSYRPADEELDFLEHDNARGVRLMLDYLKPESLLDQHSIKHTIVVFGSTRICEPSVAKAHAEELAHQCRLAPDDAGLKRRLRRAERVLENSSYYEMAQAFGRIVGEQEGPHGRRLVIVTGGGPGIMEAANRGASEVGARTVGLNITLPHEQYPNPYLTPGLGFRLRYFGIRKLHFLLRARALVIFPGGYGTLDELFETLTLIQTRKIAPMPVILVGERYWRRVFDPAFLVDEGVIDPEDLELFSFAETADEIWADILNWYEHSNSAFVP